MICYKHLLLVLGVLNNSLIPGYLTWIKPYNHVMLLNPKHVITLPYYVAIINSIFDKLALKKETINSDEMEIQDELVLNGITWAAAAYIEYNSICAFLTGDNNTPGYYII